VAIFLIGISKIFYLYNIELITDSWKGKKQIPLSMIQLRLLASSGLSAQRSAQVEIVTTQV
jgi:hypothetical protein